VIEDVVRDDTQRSAERGGADAGVARSLDTVSARLQSDYPSVPHERIVTLLDEAFAQTDRARVQVFRALLAERNVRAALRASITTLRA